MHALNTEIIKPGTAGIAWFGQNSFAVKDSQGVIILIDPYFPLNRDPDKFLHGNIPDYVYDLQPDIILLTHDHSDHTDVETVLGYWNKTKQITIVGPAESLSRLAAGGIAKDHMVQADPGGSLEIKGNMINGLYSKHPEGTAAKTARGMENPMPAPGTTHLGYVIKNGDGIGIYVSGDCQRDLAERKDLWEPIRNLAPRIGLLTTHPTEGEFPFFADTVKLSQKIGLDFAVPAHYECFSSRTYDPFQWQRSFPFYGPRPVIIPYNGFAVFDPEKSIVRYGYSKIDSPPKVEKVRWSGKEVYRICTESWDGLLDPAIGGNLIQLTHRQSGCEILHRPMNYETYAARPRIFGIPVILPPNRINKGRFKVHGREYTMVINSPDGHHCHGPLSLDSWKITEFGVEGGNPFITLSYENSEDNEFYQSFPHEFTVLNTYRFEPGRVVQKVSCKNLSSEPMPFGIGLHTAFSIPFDMSGRAIQVKLLLPVDKRWELDEASIPTGYMAPLQSIEDNYRSSGIPIDDQGIRDHYSGKPLDTDKGPLNGTILKDTGTGAEIIYTAEKSFTHWMIWNDGGSSGYICPEPMTWVIDAPNSKHPPHISGYKELLPGEIWEDELQIRISRPEKGKE